MGTTGTTVGGVVEGWTAAERNWIEMVAHFAANYVRAGRSDEEAVRLGMADYQRFLDRWADTFVAAEMTARDGRPNQNSVAWKAREALYAMVSSRVHVDVRAVSQ